MRKILTVLFTGLFLFGVATSAFAATSGDTIPDSFAPKYTAPLTVPDVDNGIGNANNTGKNVAKDGVYVNDVIKSLNMYMDDLTTTGNQRTHGEYQNNTNSCASCHQTHTGAAEDLLFKAGVYNTCAACHDGTLGFYNVFANGDNASSAGTFGGTKSGNASVHLANDFMLITHSYAPGGNPDSNANRWSEVFDCASCHAPHGSYSDRLLHYNPNGMAATPVSEQGQKLVGETVADALPATINATSPDFIVYRTTSDSATLDLQVTEEPAGTAVIVLMKKVQTGTDPVSGNPIYAYKRELTPWLYGYSHYGAPYYTQFLGSDSKAIDLERNYGKAYAKNNGAALVANAVTADISRVYVVKLAGNVYNSKTGALVKSLPMQQIANFGGISITAVNPDIYDEYGYGVAIGKYCGACHVDYRAKSGSETGMYSLAYRHTTDNDSYTCLKCHFAHGTDVMVMKDALDNTVDSLVYDGTASAVAMAYMLDKNPSSALKRFTNMSVCWKCHTSSKAEQLKNNTFYWNDPNVPHGPSNW